MGQSLRSPAAPAVSQHSSTDVLWRWQRHRLGDLCNDTVDGVESNDTLIGGTGADRLRGDNGVYRFVFDDGDTALAPSGT
jgi:hypothetical protein